MLHTNPIFELGIFDSVIDLSSSRTMLIWNCAFLSGRSKHGNARLASIGENCVLASHLWKGKKKRRKKIIKQFRSVRFFVIFFLWFLHEYIKFTIEVRFFIVKHFKIITSFLGSFHLCRTIDKILVECPLACW